MSELGALTAEPGFMGTRLGAPVERIVDDLQRLGETVAVTMNTAAVITRIGCYGAPQCSGTPLACGASSICLRLHEAAVDTALAVERMPMNRLPCSLQLFDAAGAVLHKSFLTDCTDDLAFGQLCLDWEARDLAGRRPQVGGLGEGALPAPAAFSPDGDCAAQLDSIFGDSGIRRRAALPGWGEEWAWRVLPDVVFDLLVLASEVRMPLVQAVGNAGTMQVHRGPVEQVRRSGPLLVLASETSTLSIELNEVEEAWVTRFDAGPDADGLMVELYDWRFHCVAQFTALGLPNPGLGSYWEQLVFSLPRAPMPERPARR
ncbi:hemin-degrading factor [Azorhizobium oxalatiphilum]|uniref:Hemin-degrading factor n=1 Tax=Azorhizobium oxalatiphilum TaxID=980631 RepID=A0A917BKV9_9HYPH|nr:ChuX/HutX family heme-like substrate-binding protein [Azorhizobium oxalatiphilum]GGF50069.1 hemin-degrading factor [Azorhizobium oxalatiphilum]